MRLPTKFATFIATTSTTLRLSAAFSTTAFPRRVYSTTAIRMHSLSNPPILTLRNGMEHPAIGFGTYKVGFIPASASAAVANEAPTTVERTAEECVSDALATGYRFLECAEFYGNESEVGKAIANSGVKREDLFICSKVWTTTIEQGKCRMNFLSILLHASKCAAVVFSLLLFFSSLGNDC